MARKKVDTPPALESWESVDAAFREIIECEGCIDEIEVEMNRKIIEAKMCAEEDAKPSRERIRVLEAQIKDYVIRNRDSIDGKTRKLNHGQTGFRLSTKLVIPSGKTPDVIEALRRNDMLDCITVKESVNKEVLKKYKSEDILRTGAYLRSDDEFWYEVDKAKLEATGPAQVDCHGK